MKISEVACGIAMLIFSHTLLGQSSFIPYTATTRETINNVDESGKHSLIVNEGIKARTADGSSIEEVYQPETKAPARGMLYNASEGVGYNLDFQQHTALGRDRRIGHIHPPKQQPIGHEVIGGVSATGYPMFDAQTKKVGGEIWIADGTDVIVKMKSTAPGGSTYTLELTDVKLREDPPSALFKLPSSMSISKPVHQQQ